MSSFMNQCVQNFHEHIVIISRLFYVRCIYINTFGIGTVSTELVRRHFQNSNWTWLPMFYPCDLYL